MEELSILQDSPIGVAILDTTDGSRLFVNQALVKMFGAASQAELIGRDIAETWIDPVRLAAAWSIFQDNGILTNFEAERRRLDGSLWWVLMHCQPIEFDGRQAGIVWHTDITARKRAEEAQARSEKRLSEAVENLSDGFALFDPDDRLVFCNAMFREVNPDLSLRTGMTFEDMLRENIEHGRIIPAIGREEAYMQERLLSHRNPQKPILSKRSDGRWLLLKEERAEDGSTFLINTDLTIMREREEELLRAKERAERLSRTKSDFLANMSHELRTPLNAIIGFSEMLSGDYFGPLGSQKYLEYVDDIRTSSNHLLLLINEILDLSAIEAGERLLNEQELVFRDSAEECISIMTGEIQRNGIGFASSIPDNLPTLFADSLAVKQILINLLSNAVKFTPKGGRVVLAAREKDKWFEVTVSDTGPGIPQADLEGVMEPFVRLDSDAYRSQEGTGLGLSIVKSLIELHKGELRIESEPGNGTSVTVRFPLPAPEGLEQGGSAPSLPD